MTYFVYVTGLIEQENGETISATPSHPFYVDKLGWTLARSLRAGDVLVLSNGELVTVEWVQHEILESPIKVYNFEVEEFHTYFVGENRVFVHNGCGDEKVPSRKEALNQIKKDLGISKSQSPVSQKMVFLEDSSGNKIMKKMDNLECLEN
ncbi:polymorphic toxin-type HINT domain-containing protein [Ruminococcus sp.]|uniref:polymorphic toxin-type HINT domain-containing protein n=1 Tax=Ruminococcus sp. TaxID=41978 RepID=UPI003976A2C5